MEHSEKRGLSATWLKYFACAFMLVDHVAAVLYPMANLPRFFGRLAFPVFVWFIAEGCHKTQDLPRYLKRLFLFAIVSQVPFTLATGVLGGNVMLTFFLAGAGVSFYESAREYVGAPAAVLPVLLMAALAELCHSDYSWFGVLAVLTVYLCRTKQSKLVGLGVWMAILYLIFPVLDTYAVYIPQLLAGAPLSYLWSDFVSNLHLWFPYLLPFYLLQTVFALAALIPLGFYSGARGKGTKWFFYVFYPAHLLILYFVRCF